jgi:F0F1-type ATP synthase membrane subunit c/vacuolar-type H+-ATPase subunit K
MAKSVSLWWCLVTTIAAAGVAVGMAGLLLALIQALLSAAGIRAKSRPSELR